VTNKTDTTTVGQQPWCRNARHRNARILWLVMNAMNLGKRK
jgi:hypothetical protein